MCHIYDVTALKLTLRPGESIFDQLVFAAKKAFISGELQAGQVFPSIRALAAEFKIHPNTAHKVVQHLIQERWLEVCPGIGTVVSEIRRRVRATGNGCFNTKSRNWWSRRDAWSWISTSCCKPLRTNGPDSKSRWR